MIKNLYSRTIFPLLKHLDAETAHNWTLSLLHTAHVQPAVSNMLSKPFQIDDLRLRTSAFGLQFSNPIGVAAGFDKNGTAIEGLSRLGFAHIEIGTVTPRSQTGQSKPRVFRLEKDLALINRIGFANSGVASLRQRLSQLRPRDFVLGINVGPNADNTETKVAIDDYIVCIRSLCEYADYFTINVSSPNTKGLRLLQEQQAIDVILRSIFYEMRTSDISKPLLIKISCDVTDRELLEFLSVVCMYPVSGIVATNSTTDRPNTLTRGVSKEAGGLSGRPLRERSTSTIRKIFRHTEGKLPIIGVGGIFTTADALEKIKAGASIVQLYTGIVYEGPFIAKRINRGLIEYMSANSVASIGDLVGHE